MLAASPIVDRAVAAGTPLLFLSAHLDDAVLSCGALMASVKHSSPITVATLFTAAACPPHTRAARSFLRQCDAAAAAALFAERRAEDVEVLGRWVSTTCTSSRPTRPVGVGRHVGHLITRAVGAGQHVDVVYYSDFPYNLAADPDPAFLERHRLTSWEWPHDGVKERLIRGYRTQADALFPGGEIAVVPEVYFEPGAIQSE